jgi:hypothetical protein
LFYSDDAPGDFFNEMYLLYCTTPEAAQRIAVHGFDKGPSTSHGIHLYNTLCASLRNVKGTAIEKENLLRSGAPPPGSYSSILVCKAMLGKVLVTAPEIGAPAPPRRGGEEWPIGEADTPPRPPPEYDSVVFNGEHKDFVVFDRAAVLPILLIQL